MKDKDEATWGRLIVQSYQHFLGKSLLPAQRDDAAGLLWLRDEAGFCVLAHDARSDPCFVWANAATLRCFGYTRQEFLGLPSRLSAEAPLRDEREALMARVREHGFASDYRGVRIAQDGRRFWIEDVTVWNVLDAAGERCGQAATYLRITPISG